MKTNQQLIESLQYYTYKLCETIEIPIGDEEVIKHPIYQKIAKIAQKYGGKMTSEQSNSLIALAILVKYKEKSDFSKEAAMKTLKNEFPKWTIGFGILGVILNFLRGFTSIPAIILSFLVNGLLYGAGATALSALLSKNSASAYYDWAEEWALEHDWIDRNGNLKNE